MKTWTTRDGAELKISEMETSHIKNCIRYLNDNPIAYGSYGMDIDDMYFDTDYELTEEYIAVFEKELLKRK